MEAESVSYLVCKRLGLDTPSEAYLAHFVKQHEQVPQVSLECIVKAAGLIETMGKENLKPRQDGP